RPAKRSLHCFIAAAFQWMPIRRVHMSAPLWCRWFACRTRRKLDRPCRCDSFAFLDCHKLIDGDVGDRFFAAAWPGNLDIHCLYGARFAKTEGERQFALREIARSGF